MAVDHGTFPWGFRGSSGTQAYKQLWSTTFGYTETQKKVAAGSTSAVLAATNGATAAQVVTAGITQPDVPRVLSVSPTVNNTGGNPMSITITGVNVEGKIMTEAFIIPVGSTSTVNGSKAFKSVTSVTIPQQTVGLTITVGTRNVLGLKHRIFNQNTTVKVYSYSTVYGALTLQAAPTVVANEPDIELNTVQPATTPNGSTSLIICYAFDNWSDGSSVNDQPEYSTTTSTSSTSSSTSTTTITTSTSSTSVSTSSTSSSSTSSSISTSSTSTSTTTAP